MNQAQGTVASEAAGPAAAPAARSRPLSAKDRADEAEEVGSSSSSYEGEESGDDSDDDSSDSDRDEVQVVGSTGGSSSLNVPRAAAAAAFPAVAASRDQTEQGGGSQKRGGGGSSGAANKKQKGSVVWEYFNKDPKDKEFAVCKHCTGSVGRIKRSGGNTSSMLKHLNQVHHVLMLARGLSNDNTQAVMDDMVVFAPNFKRDSIFWQLTDYQVRHVSLFPPCVRFRGRFVFQINFCL